VRRLYSAPSLGRVIAGKKSSQIECRKTFKKKLKLKKTGIIYAYSHMVIPSGQPLFVLFES
jgi:hypothetical protein